jgi:hypothetical protein
MLTAPTGRRKPQTRSSSFFTSRASGGTPRTFAPLCRLAKDAEAIEAVLGDGITATLKGILISTYDGDLGALKGVIEAESSTTL